MLISKPGNGWFFPLRCGSAARRSRRRTWHGILQRSSAIVERQIASTAIVRSEWLEPRLLLSGTTLATDAEADDTGVPILESVTSTFASSNVPVAIENKQTVASSLIVADDISIDDVNISIDVSHPFVSELEVFLISPAGTRVELFTNLNNAGANLSGVILDDEADDSITSAGGTISGRFRPEGSLARLDGEFTLGTWTLEITDTFDFDDGVLNSWSLEVTPASPVNLSGIVFLDVDADGNRGPRDIGIGNVEVFADSNGDGIRTGNEPFVVTDSAGRYTFTDLEVESFRVTAVQPENLNPTTPVQEITVGVGRTTFANPIGFSGSDSIQGTVFIDQNTNGFFEVDEPGSGNTRVFIDWNSNGVVDAGEPSALTDANGSYEISNLFSGVHRVSIADRIPLVSPPDNQVFVATSPENSPVVNFAVQGVVVAEPNETPDTATFIAPSSSIRNSLTSGDRDFFQFEITESGRFRAIAEANGLDRLKPQLRLLSATGDLILTGSLTRFTAGLEIHLLPGLYRLEVAALANTTGDYSLQTVFDPAERPFDPIVPVDLLSGQQFRETIAAGDFNGDGMDDLASATSLGNKLSILLSHGDGSFRNAYTIEVDQGPRFLTTVDLNRDGVLDLISANGGANSQSINNTVSVFVGVGNGTFLPETRYVVGDRPRELTTADFNLDGFPDLATVNVESGDVTVLIGAGDGTFESIYSIPAGPNPESLTSADLNGDGNPDLAVINDVREPNTNIGTVSVLAGDGTGSFSEPSTFSLRKTVTSSAPSVKAGDINSDGVMDLVTVHNSSEGAILLGIRNGRFDTATELPLGDFGKGLILEDLTGDGHLDIASANDSGGDVSIRTGIGDGTFGSETRFPVADGPVMLATGDFNGDTQPDLAVASLALFNDAASNSISLIFNRGDGIFQGTSSTRLRIEQTATTQIADLNDDGIPEIISATPRNFDAPGSITVLNGVGNGEFESTASLSVSALSVAVGDVNRDGRPDLVSVNGTDGDLSSFIPTSGAVTVHLGIGDGEFELPRPFSVGINPVSVILNDFNNDGILDIATANELPTIEGSSNGTVSILTGNGDGSFQSASTFEAGAGPSSVIAEDFDRDGSIDLAVSNRGLRQPELDNRIFIYWGRGDGTFETPQIETVGNGPSKVIAADLNLDGVLELVTFDQGPGLGTDGNVESIDTITILTISGGRQFAVDSTVSIGNFMADLAIGDFDGNAIPDLVAIDSTTPDISKSAVLLGHGDLSFSAPLSIPLDGDSVQTADLNGDEVLDLVSSHFFRDRVSVVLGLGDGSFVAPDELANFTASTAILFAEVSGDGIDDVVTLNQDGRVEIRTGRESINGLLAPPFVLNPDAPARAIASLAGTAEVGLAAVSRNGRQLTVYSLNANGQPAIRQQVALPGFVSTIVTSDVTGDGVDDVVGILPLTRQVLVIDGGLPFTAENLNLINITAVPTVVDISDTNGDSFPDILVTSREDGTLSVLSNDGAGDFSLSSIVRTSDEPVALARVESSGLISLANPVVQQVGDFNGDGITDLLITNQGQRSLTLLHGTGNGFSRPVRLILDSTASELDVIGNVLQVQDSNQDGMVDQIITAATNGNVINVLKFTGSVKVDTTQSIATRSKIVDLDVKDFDGDGVSDLIASTATGDLLIFPGRSDGTFAELVQSQSTVPIAVRDLDGDGTLDVVTANSGRDRVTIDFGAGTESDVTLNDDDAEFSAPGAVELADINRDGLEDLVVANTGGNEVFLFPRLGAQRFATEPIILFSGTNPTGITVDDVNADGINDLVVANRGSNDVTIFAGSTTTETGFDVGRRLVAGAGPVSAEVITDEGTGDIAGLVVTNADEGTVSMLPAVQGLGGSIFNDQSASTIPIGQTSAQGGQIIGNSFVATNPLNDSFIFIPDLQNAFQTGQGISSFASRGNEPSFLLPTDFNFDGVLDLIVANSGDGTVALFAGDGLGFLFSDLLTSPGLAHPAAMDIAEIDGVLNLFVTDEGEDVATVFKFSKSLSPEEPDQAIPINRDRFAEATSDTDGIGTDDQNQADWSVRLAEARRRLNIAAAGTPLQLLSQFFEPRFSMFTWEGLAMSFQRAIHSFHQFLLPGEAESYLAEGTTLRGIQPKDHLFRSALRTTILRTIPLHGLLINPWARLLSDSAELPAPEGGDSELRMPDDKSAEKTSDSPGESPRSGTETKNPPGDAPPEGSDPVRGTTQLVPGSERGISSAQRRAGSRQRCSYRPLDGLFVDLTSKASVAIRLFDENTRMLTHSGSHATATAQISESTDRAFQQSGRASLLNIEAHDDAPENIPDDMTNCQVVVGELVVATMALATCSGRQSCED